MMTRTLLMWQHVVNKLSSRRVVHCPLLAAMTWMACKLCVRCSAVSVSANAHGRECDMLCTVPFVTSSRFLHARKCKSAFNALHSCPNCHSRTCTAGAAMYAGERCVPEGARAKRYCWAPVFTSHCRCGCSISWNTFTWSVACKSFQHAGSLSRTAWPTHAILVFDSDWKSFSAHLTACSLMSM